MWEVEGVTYTDDGYIPVVWNTNQNLRKIPRERLRLMWLGRQHQTADMIGQFWFGGVRYEDLLGVTAAIELKLQEIYDEQEDDAGGA
jgi:hypothetical protein